MDSKVMAMTPDIAANVLPKNARRDLFIHLSFAPNQFAELPSRHEPSLND